MSHVHPVESLMQEHRVIERVLNAMERMLSRDAAGPFPAEFFEKALDFFRTYADSCHHFKEEECLFPAMGRSGFPADAGPVGMMRYEHEIGRAHLRGIREHLPAAAAGDRGAIETIHQQAFGYIQLLRGHIQKEDHVLFQMALHALSAAEFDALRAAFADESNPRINQALHARYEALAAALEEESLPEAIH
jgi:hemerythrin-like domain-containing protein